MTVPAGGLAVSVVVPVYNAGAFLERCAPSLLDQSIGADAYEVIYVDDGSTDGSAEVLDRLAAVHPQVRVHHQENSGWPGKPRNVGIGMARGAYVQFVDQDDRLAPEALERLHALAVRSEADIVIGLLAGTMIGARRLYRANVEGASLAESGAIESLTGHKMFRRAFLDQHDIRFPEGYWRMEDLLFVLRAYVRQPVVSVLADYPCYFWDRRDDGENHSRAAYELEGHYERLRVLFDTVRDGVEPGELQDQLVRRLFRAEVLSKVAGASVLVEDEERSRLAHKLSREVAADYLTPTVRAGLVGMQGLRVDVLQHGTWEDVRLLAEREKELRPRASVGTAAWDGGSLVVPVSGRLERQGEPLVVARHQDGYGWDPGFVAGLPADAAGAPVDPLAELRGDVTIRDRERTVSWFADGTLTPGLLDLGAGRLAPVVDGEVRLDPARIAGGGPLGPGRYPLTFHAHVLGMSRGVPLRAEAPVRGRVVFGAPPMLASVGTGRRGRGRLELVVRPAVATLSRELARRPVTGRSSVLPRRRPISLDVGLRRLRLPEGGLVLAADPFHVSLRRGPNGRSRLVLGRRTTAPRGIRRVALGPGALGSAVVVGGRVWWFVGAGALPGPRRVVRALRGRGRRRAAR